MERQKEEVGLLKSRTTAEARSTSGMTDKSQGRDVASAEDVTQGRERGEKHVNFSLLAVLQSQ